MMRKSVLATLCLALCLPPMARAKDPLKRALSAIPADAVAFVLVPSIEQADADFQRTIEQLGLGMMPYFQPPMNSISGLMGQYLQMKEGLDTAGPLAVVVMPFDMPMEMSAKQALIVPASDPKALLEGMGGTAGEGDVWTVGIMGMPHQAVAGKDHVVLSMNPEIAKSVAGCEKSIASTLEKSELEALEKLDLALWVNGDVLITKFRQQIDGMLQMMMAIQAAQQPLMAEAQQAQMKMFVDGIARGIIGVSLDEGGLGLRFMMTMKPESEMAKLYTIHTTKRSLLKGLPAGKYIGAFGQVVDPEQTKASIKQAIEPYLAVLKGQEGVDPEQVDRVRSSLEEWAVLAKSMRGSIEATPPGPEGLFAGNLIFETTDSGKWMELARKLVGEALAFKLSDDDFKEFMELVSHKADVEEIGGVKVDHIKIDVMELAKREDAPEEDVENWLKVIGKEGIVFRMGAVDSKTVVVCLGGKESTARLIERAKANDAPLDDDTGIKKVSRHLPEERQSVGFLALDNVVELVRNIADAMDEEMPPILMPPIQAPLALSGTGGKDWMQADLLVPTELMIAGKNVGMMMMGMMGAGGQQGEQTPPPPPDEE